MCEKSSQATSNSFYTLKLNKFFSNRNINQYSFFIAESLYLLHLPKFQEMLSHSNVKVIVGVDGGSGGRGGGVLLTR